MKTLPTPMQPPTASASRSARIIRRDEVALSDPVAGVSRIVLGWSTRSDRREVDDTAATTPPHHRDGELNRLKKLREIRPDDRVPAIGSGSFESLTQCAANNVEGRSESPALSDAHSLEKPAEGILIENVEHLRQDLDAFRLESRPGFSKHLGVVVAESQLHARASEIGRTGPTQATSP